jgi:hypothetical protein
MVNSILWKSRPQKKKRQRSLRRRPTRLRVNTYLPGSALLLLLLFLVLNVFLRWLLALLAMLLSGRALVRVVLSGVWGCLARVVFLGTFYSGRSSSFPLSAVGCGLSPRGRQTGIIKATSSLSELTKRHPNGKR